MKKRVLALTLCFVLILNVVAVASDDVFAVVRDVATGTVTSYNESGESLGEFIPPQVPWEIDNPWAIQMWKNAMALVDLMTDVGANDIDELLIILYTLETPIADTHRELARDLLRCYYTENKLAGDSYMVVRDIATGTITSYCMMTNEPLGEFIMPPAPRRREPHPHTVRVMAMHDLMRNLGANDIDELMQIMYGDESSISEAERKLANELLGDILGVDLFAPASAARHRVPNTRVAPYNAVALVEMQFEVDGLWSPVATAFMVNDNHAVTAGHVILLNGGGGDWALNIRISPGATTPIINQGITILERPFGTHYVRRQAVSPSWARYGYVGGDYGVLMLYTTPRVSRFWLRTVGDAQSANLPVTMAGFPQAVPQFTRSTMVRSPGRIYNVLHSLIHTSAIGNPGVSGSPIFDQAGWAVGIATGSVYAHEPHQGNTRGVRIAPGLINWLRSLGAQ